jgi:hypothetical protein
MTTDGEQGYRFSIIRLMIRSKKMDSIPQDSVHTSCLNMIRNDVTHLETINQSIAKQRAASIALRRYGDQSTKKRKRVEQTDSDDNQSTKKCQRVEQAGSGDNQEDPIDLTVESYTHPDPYPNTPPSPKRLCAHTQQPM